MSHMRHNSRAQLFICAHLFTCFSWLIQICVMTYSYRWHDMVANEQVTFESHVLKSHVMNLNEWCLTCECVTPWWSCLMVIFTRVTWLINMCGMTHSYVWHDSFMRVPWVIRTHDMSHPYMCRELFVHVTWFLDDCNRGARGFICMSWLIVMGVFRF